MASGMPTVIVGVAEVEADADLVQVAGFEDFHQMLGGGGFAEQVLHQQTHAQRAGECAEVLESGEGVLDGARRPLIVALAEMDDEVAEGELLGGFQGALDLVHGRDAAALLRVQQVDGGRAGAAHLAVGIERGVHRKGVSGLERNHAASSVDLLAAGVVEVLARGKDLDRLRAGSVGELQQPRVQALIHEEVRRQNSQLGHKIPPRPPGAAAIVAGTGIQRKKAP